MGKKSKRKAVNKKEHKEKLEERRERQLEVAAAVNNEGNDNDSPSAENGDNSKQEESSIEVGDRVWYAVKHDDSGVFVKWCRGVVKEIENKTKRDRPWARDYTIVPVDASDRKENYVNRLEQSRPRDFLSDHLLKQVRPDHFEWALRFAAGDPVVCYVGGRWYQATVKSLFPTDTQATVKSLFPTDTKALRNVVEHYECEVDTERHPQDSLPNFFHNGCCCYVSKDTDECIIERPRLFRFSVGERVIFNSNSAAFNTKLPARRERQKWIEGTVRSVDCVGRDDFYAFYECSFTDANSKRNTAFILYDDDEHIANTAVSPRERLFEAIEQGCSRAHIQYLVTEYGLDVSSFQDLVLEKAIYNGSYDTLRWLVEEAGVHGDAIIDSNGDGVLHQIVKGRGALRFFQAIASDRLDLPDSANSFDGFLEISLRQRNKSGELFLNSLVRENNIRVLSLVFSPATMLSWKLSSCLSAMSRDINNFSTPSLLGQKDLRGRNIRDIAQETDHHQVLKMIDEFSGWQMLDETYSRCRYEPFDLSDILEKYELTSRNFVASRLIRFCRTFGALRSLNELISDLITSGRALQYFRLVWLVSADANIASSFRTNWSLTSNINEFAQIELFDCDFDPKSPLDLVSVVAHGKVAPIKFLIRRERVGTSFTTAQENYANILGNFMLSNEKEKSLASMLKMITETKIPTGSFRKTLLEYKLRLLQDDDNLDVRLKTIHLLVNESGLSPPNAVDLIRWRQCGVLRWLVGMSYVDLESPANAEEHILCRVQSVSFWGEKKSTERLKTGEFFILSAIEFDDLQTVQWLVEVQSVAVENITCDGWNALHVCAYYGRTEIAHWLLNHCRVVKSQLTVVCGRKPWQNLYAAHLAVSKGFVVLADFLLREGCPSVDAAGMSIDEHARRSTYDFVQKWGEAKTKPLKLQKDIETLLRMLREKIASWSALKQFIAESRCLQPTTWLDCGVESTEKLGPLGLTYTDSLIKCCSSVADADVITWLFSTLLSSKHEEAVDLKFWEDRKGAERMTCSKISVLQADVSDPAIASILKTVQLVMPCAKEILFDDPLSRFPSVRKTALHFQNQRDISLAFSQLQDMLTSVAILDELLCLVRREAHFQIRMGDTETISGLYTIMITMINELKDRGALKSDADAFRDSPFTAEGKLNLDSNVLDQKRLDSVATNPLSFQMPWAWKVNLELDNKVYIAMAAEGNLPLILWSLGADRNLWDAKKEVAVVRIAAYRGFAEIIGLFLEGRSDVEFKSARSDRLYAATCGAAESGRLDDMESYIRQLSNENASLDPIMPDLQKELDDIGEKDSYHHDEFEDKIRVMQSSLLCSAVYGCLVQSRDPLLPQQVSLPSTGGYRLLEWISAKNLKSAGAILQAMNMVLHIIFNADDLSSYERYLSMLKFLDDEMKFDLWTQRDKFQNLLWRLNMLVREANIKASLSFATRFVTYLLELGISIQSLECPGVDDYFGAEFAPIWYDLQLQQRSKFNKLNVLKKGGDLAEIKQAVKTNEIELSSHDGNGLPLLHLASAYDRQDVIQWLVDEEGISLRSLDGHGRTVLEVANSSNSITCVKWIEKRNAAEVISLFLSSRYRAWLVRKKKKMVLHSFVALQARYRGRLIRRQHRSRLLKHLDGVQKFSAVWNSTLETISRRGVNMTIAWSKLKQKHHDTVRSTNLVDPEEFSGTMKTLETASAKVLAESKALDVDYEDETDDEIVVREAATSQRTTNRDQNVPEELPRILFDRIKMTKETTKWLKTCDSKFREFFVRRMRQLAAGDRSRILSKRLTGCKTTIYETYLEQKSGHRILWTEDENAENSAKTESSLVIWYVAKHDNVSRLIALIDDAESRSRRQYTAISELPELKINDVDPTGTAADAAPDLMLDPLGDTPLKLFEVRYDEIEKVKDANWKPRLYLSPLEREIVQSNKGTILLLGRSGTGKTACICSRMEYDRYLYEQTDKSFSQLFVARSEGLCAYVKDAIDIHPKKGFSSGKGIEFTTFMALIQSLERVFPPDGESTTAYSPNNTITFNRFKRDIWKASSGNIDALIAWTSIRSFIKGSIEALQLRRPLSEEEYLDLGKKRCRLSPEQRREVYSVFRHYEQYRADFQLYDDCDRISSLLYRIQDAKMADSLAFVEACYSKIYVDEIQDFTQAEIALFFYLCGPGNLFLAGDPAQSVVEGVEFRFEEVRSVGYFLCGDDRSLIPDKPLTVNVNYRSHTGVLNVAAGILHLLFGVFPDAAKQLSKDRGIFQGPRPAVLHRLSSAQLKELVSKLDGCVILTHDRDAPRLRRDLGYPLVYGIAQAKGLEFSTVLMVNFFRGLPTHLQRPLRDIFLGRDSHEAATEFPEIEGIFKRFYTGTTRCIQRLYFIETQQSVSHDGFLRWITTTKAQSNEQETLAIQQNAADVEKLTKSPDEWRSAGLDNAVVAEYSEDPKKADQFLEKAIFCFEQIGDNWLARKARAHKQSARFRFEFENVTSQEDFDSDALELETASIVEKLIAEDLFAEARHVLGVVLPVLSGPTQDLVSERVLSRIQ